MLSDPERFASIEEFLRKNGSVERFENEYGKIKGRMMITMAEIPDGFEIMPHGDEVPIAFEASFDFFDSVAGLAMYTADRRLATEMWVTPQKDNADPPTEDWIEFFIKTLVDHIAEDGSFGVPIYSLVNDTCDMTVVPVPEPQEDSDEV
mgnify:CR=1 FL=1